MLALVHGYAQFSACLFDCHAGPEDGDLPAENARRLYASLIQAKDGEYQPPVQLLNFLLALLRNERYQIEHH